MNQPLWGPENTGAKGEPKQQGGPNLSSPINVHPVSAPCNLVFISTMYSYACRSADERVARDGVRRSVVGPAGGVNGSTIKRVFNGSDRSANCDADNKRPRRDANDGDVFTLKVCSKLSLSLQ